MPRLRITKDQIDGYLEFTHTLNYLLGQVHKLDLTRDYKIEALWLWIHHIKPLVGIHQMKAPYQDWDALSVYCLIEPKYIFGTIRSTKFVQYKDFSLTNFLLQHFDFEKFNIRATYLELPDHVELKSFFVPEELIIKDSQDTIYNADWI